MTFSPDTLALNPDFARQQRKSKRKTPSGKGHHGHVPDAQHYEVQTTPHRELCRINARIAYNILSGHVGKLNDSKLESRLAAVLGALARIIGE